MKITENMTMAELIRARPDAAKVLQKFGMHCIGCALASDETIKQASETHSINLQELLKALNT